MILHTLSISDQHMVLFSYIAEFRDSRIKDTVASQWRVKTFSCKPVIGAFSSQWGNTWKIYFKMDAVTG